MDPGGTYCLPQDPEYWEAMKHHYKDRTALLAAKEEELRRKLAQMQSALASHDIESPFRRASPSRTVPKVFPQKMDIPNNIPKVIREPSPPPTRLAPKEATADQKDKECYPSNFFQKVMENAKSILTMRCQAIHPSNPLDEKPTKENDASCPCTVGDQQLASPAKVSFNNAAPLDLIDDATTDNCSQEVNTSYSCSLSSCKNLGTHSADTMTDSRTMTSSAPVERNVADGACQSCNPRCGEGVAKGRAVEFGGGRDPCQCKKASAAKGKKRGAGDGKRCTNETCPVVQSRSAPDMAAGVRSEGDAAVPITEIRIASKQDDDEAPVYESDDVKIVDLKSKDSCACDRQLIASLAAKEKQIKSQIQDLQQRERSYDNLMGSFRNMASRTTCCCTIIEQPNGDFDRLGKELKVENKMLRSELDEMKMELRHCLERIQGPMRQKLEAEKCRCMALEGELSKASQSMAVNHDTHVKEMNALKMQLCMACNNIAELNSMNRRLKEEMSGLDSMCAKLEDDLMKQKISEAETIRRLTRRKPQYEEESRGVGGAIQGGFRCDSNLDVIARKLSKTLKESEPCEECSKLPPELSGAARCIKDLTDLVQQRKKEVEAVMGTRRDTSSQSPNTKDVCCQCCFDCMDVGVGGDSRVDAGVGEGVPEMASAYYSAQGTPKPSGDMTCGRPCDPTQPCVVIGTPCGGGAAPSPVREEVIVPQKAYAVETTSEPALVDDDVCKEPCGDDAPCARGKPCFELITELSEGEAVVESPMTKRLETGLGAPPSRAGEMDQDKISSTLAAGGVEQAFAAGRPSAASKPSEELSSTPLDADGSKANGYEGDASSKLATPSEAGEKPSTEIDTQELAMSGQPSGASGIPGAPSHVSEASAARGAASEGGGVPLAPSGADGMPYGAPGTVEGSFVAGGGPQVVSAGGFKEEWTGNFPFEVETHAEVLQEPPADLQITTTITASGTLEVITEAPGGIIETTLTYNDDGTIEVFTQLTEEGKVAPPGMAYVGSVISEAARQPEAITAGVKDSIMTAGETDQSGGLETVSESRETTLVSSVSEVDKTSALVGTGKIDDSGDMELVTEKEVSEVSELPTSIAEESAEPIAEDNALKEEETVEEVLIQEETVEETVEDEAVAEPVEEGVAESVEEVVETAGEVAETVQVIDAVEEEPSAETVEEVAVEEVVVEEEIVEEQVVEEEIVEEVVEEEAAAGAVGAARAAGVVDELVEEVVEDVEAIEEAKFFLNEGAPRVTEGRVMETEAEEGEVFEDAAAEVAEEGKTSRVGKPVCLCPDQPTAEGKGDATPPTEGGEAVVTAEEEAPEEEAPEEEAAPEEAAPEEEAVPEEAAPEEEAVPEETAPEEVASEEEAKATEGGEATEGEEAAEEATPETVEGDVFESAEEGVLIEPTEEGDEGEQAVIEGEPESEPTEEGEAAEEGEAMLGPAEGEPTAELAEEEGAEKVEVEEEGKETAVGPGGEGEVDDGAEEECHDIVEGIATKATEGEEPAMDDGQKRDSSCQSTAAVEQSCQCCECKNVGVSTTQDSETVTDEAMVQGPKPTPIDVIPEEAEPEADSEIVTGDTQASDETDFAEAATVEGEKISGTTDEVSTLNEDEYSPGGKKIEGDASEYTTAQETSEAQECTAPCSIVPGTQGMPVEEPPVVKDEIPAVMAEPKPSEAKPSEANLSETEPSEAQPAEEKLPEVEPTEAQPAEARPSKTKPTSEIKGKCSTFDKAEISEPCKDEGIQCDCAGEVEPDDRSEGRVGSSESDTEIELPLPVKVEAEKKTSEVPESVSKLSDKASKAPSVTSSGSRKPRRKRSSRLDSIRCNCPGVCQCVVCAPEIIAKRRAMTGSSLPAAGQPGKLCCCIPHSQPQAYQAPPLPPPQMMQAYMQPQPMPFNHPAGCACAVCVCNCTPGPRFRTSVDDVFKPMNGNRHPPDCECVDCLCMPTLKELTSLRGIPPIRDEKQVYQVKCVCPKKPSRIPIATNSPVGPPKAKVTCTCEQCSCSPCLSKDHGKEDAAGPAKPAGPDLASLCDCKDCQCTVCFNKPPKKAGGVEKDCCCKGDCTCGTCPVEKVAADAPPPPPAPQDGGPGHPEGCNCTDCLCPKSPAYFSEEAPAEDTAGKKQPPPGCTCSVCNCPGLTAGGDDANKPQGCTCTVCDCPGLDKAMEGAKKPIVAECDCPDCECSPCADPKRRPEQPAGLSPCDCPECKCEPCADPNVSGAKGDQPKTKHPTTCDCPECVCEGQRCLQTESVGVGSTENKATHTPDCICEECLCDTEEHESGCTCPECVCSDCIYLKTDKQTGEEGCTCGDCKCTDCPKMRKEGGAGEGACTCSPCECIDCTYMKDQAADECKCGDCKCVECAKKKTDVVAPSDEHGDTCNCSDCFFKRANEQLQEECKCGDCKCTDCPKKRAEPSQPAPAAAAGPCACIVCECDVCSDPTKKSTKKKAGDAGKGCTCMTCLCVDCAGKKAEGEKEGCTCGDCKCVECVHKKGAKGDKGKPDAVSVADICHCADCKCSDCVNKKSKGGKPTAAPPADPPPFTAPAKEDCKCGKCDCAVCNAKGGASRDRCTCPKCDCSPCTKPGGPKSGGGAKSGDGASQDPPPFEVPVRAPCVCNKCDCVTCDKGGGAAPQSGNRCTCPKCDCAPCLKMDPKSDDQCTCSKCECETCVKKRGGGPSKGGDAPKPGGGADPPPFQAPARDPCTCKVCDCISCNKAGAGGGSKPDDQCTCGKCDCEKCLKMKGKEGDAPKPAGGGGGAPPPFELAARDPCTCKNCECVTCVKAGGGGGKSGDQCTCAKCDCKPCSKNKGGSRGDSGAPPFEVPVREPCTCKVCNCVACNKSYVPSKSAAASATVSQCDCATCTCLEFITPIVPEPKPMSAKASAATAPPSKAPTPKPSTNAAQGDKCSCNNCDCDDCPLDAVQGSRSREKKQATTVNKSTEIVKGVKSSSKHDKGDLNACTCPVAPNVSRMGNAELMEKIKKDTKESCECREQIKELKRALEKIKCACSEAEAKASTNKPFVKQASAFGQTMSGLKVALANLQGKCKAKDKLITVMTEELKLRTSSNTVQKVMQTNMCADPLDYDRADDVRTLDSVSTNVLYAVGEEREIGHTRVRPKSSECAAPCKGTDAEKPRKSKRKSRSHRDKEAGHVDLSGFEVVDIRRITQDSIIIKWKPPKSSLVTGYDIFINGVNKSKVMSGGRTSAMIHSLDLSATIQITIYAVTKCGRCEPPAIAIYEIGC